LASQKRPHAAQPGLKYDVKNITDLIRYLTPLPVPHRWRRRMMVLGSNDPSARYAPP
jgi:hypothetical protein